MVDLVVGQQGSPIASLFEVDLIHGLEWSQIVWFYQRMAKVMHPKSFVITSG